MENDQPTNPADHLLDSESPLMQRWQEIQDQTAPMGARAKVMSNALDEVSQNLDEANEALKDAKVDPVTGLPNSVAFAEEYPRYFYDGENQKRDTLDNLVVCYMDVNGLKVVNDERGHSAGDELLRQSAAKWKMALRPQDRIYRIGGDEFVALIDSPPEALEDIKNRLKAVSIEAARNNGLKEGDPSGVSVGMQRRRSGDTPEDTLHWADVACDADKKLYKDELREAHGTDYTRD